MAKENPPARLLFASVANTLQIGEIMKKKITMIMMSLFLIVCLTGCVGNEMSMSVEKDGTCSYTMTYLYSKALIQAFNGMDEAIADNFPAEFARQTVTRGNTEYQAFTRTFSFQSTEDLKRFMTDDAYYLSKLREGASAPDKYEADNWTATFSNAVVTPGAIEATVRSNSLASTMDEMDLTALIDQNEASMYQYHSLYEYLLAQGFLINIQVSLPYDITESNGTAQGKTVTWDLTNFPADGRLIAHTAYYDQTIATDNTAPVITGVEEGKTYGKKALALAYDNVSLQDFYLDGFNSNSASIVVSKSGSHTVIAKDSHGNTTTVNFVLDATKPKIRGAKNGKVYKKAVTLRFSDKNGIRSVKINGKKANKKKVTIRKAGKYKVVVTDKYQNVSRIRFTIRKK